MKMRTDTRNDRDVDDDQRETEAPTAIPDGSHAMFLNSPSM